MNARARQNPKAIKELEDDFCTCVYEGEGNCHVHGPYNPVDIGSCLANLKMPPEMALVFSTTDNIDPVTDLPYSTIYGWGRHPGSDTSGLYITFVNDKYGHTYHFVSRNHFTEEDWVEMMTAYPQIRITWESWL